MATSHSEVKLHRLFKLLSGALEECMSAVIRILFFCLCFSLPAHASETDPHEEEVLTLSTRPLFVSLGGTCHTALALRGTELRKAAFPFDWFISTHHDNFIKILDDDFSHFTDTNCFFLYIPAPINNYYAIQFTHDFDLNYSDTDNRKKQLSDFQEKYGRRIERFRKLRNIPARFFSSEQCGHKCTREKTVNFMKIQRGLKSYGMPWIDIFRN